MSTSYSGGCACGAVRYNVSGEPVAMVDCQCRQCQRESGTGHQSHMVFMAAEVEIHGSTSAWEMTGDGGTLKRPAFCPTCGSPVFMTFPATPDIFILRPASLDQPEHYKPTLVTWTEAAQAWDHVDPTAASFPRMPPAG
ncbi:conserved protein of unknown function [Pseudorhizobium banfieldiae]|uniref:CENP-V/GFA domain-containing protein n=1 Tax=Pseudorhizobium banfieldiae TaxID=1125847 RepID=L0NH09_9HYPH|nr:GFA family protein [Pseudorhizobium banfieldiae]CAD6615003.1 aldehyde-activating protein [arsenite-oxidising bacterium NT-25]CCF20139.1 conserved protein of unknown function [Pseudorhizobium banfieldiae]